MSKPIQWINWSHSFISYPDSIEYPSSEKDLKQIVLKAINQNQTIKVIGSGHSCSLISQTNRGCLVNLKNYNKILNLDKTSNYLTVEGGTSLDKIAKYALNHQLAFTNLGTIVEQSISGAISTGTHGSGIKHGSIDQSIVAFTMVTALGEIKSFDKTINPDEFYLAVVGLGALGIISTVTIELVATYNLAISTKTLSFKEMIANIHQSKTDDYMRFWWAPHTNKVQYWKAERTHQNPTKKLKLKAWYQDIFLGNKLHEFGLWFTSYIPSFIPNLNRFMFQRLLAKETNYVTNFLDGFTLPINVKQSVMEYGIPVSETAEVLKKINSLLLEKKYRVHMPIEVRFAPKNKAALSMAYNTTTCYIGIIAYKPYGKVLDYENYFKDVHTIFAQHHGRPHWAKVTHYSKTELNAVYPKWSAFKALKEQLDPEEMFTNKFLKRIL